MTNFGTPVRDPAAYLDHALKHGRYRSALGPGPWNSPSFRNRLERAHAAARHGPDRARTCASSVS